MDSNPRSLKTCFPSPLYDTLAAARCRRYLRRHQCAPPIAPVSTAVAASRIAAQSRRPRRRPSRTTTASNSVAERRHRDRRNVARGRFLGEYTLRTPRFPTKRSIDDRLILRSARDRALPANNSAHDALNDASAGPGSHEKQLRIMSGWFVQEPAERWRPRIASHPASAAVHNPAVAEARCWPRTTRGPRSSAVRRPAALAGRWA